MAASDTLWERHSAYPGFDGIFHSGRPSPRTSSALVRIYTLLFALLLGWVSAHADVVLLVEEPINLLGRITATGHAALLVGSLCSDDHRTMRVCRAGETGAVLTRTGGIGGRDWLAMTPTAYLYSQEDGTEVPARVTRADVDRMRRTYRVKHAAEFGAEQPSDAVWTQLLGTAYRRRVLCLRVHTTSDQDLRLMAWLNGRGKTRFNFYLANCADFVREALDATFGGAVRRNLVFDAGFTTPKALAASLHGYSKRHPELGFEVSVVGQVPGEIARSHKVYGVVESVAKTQYYTYVAAIFVPYGMGSALVVGLCDRRWSPESERKTAPAFVLRRVPDQDGTVAETGVQ